MSRAVIVALAAQPLVAAASESSHAANPIRKVVNLLQSMETKVQAEGKEAQELFEKFVCYCKSSGGDLQASITAASDKLPQLASSIEAAKGRKTQLESALKGHQVDRKSAKDAMATATALRAREQSAYDKLHADFTANIAAMKKAVAALEKGMGGSFLQTNAADIVRTLVTSRENMLNSDREEVLAFLEGKQGGEYAPSSGEITGILKQMRDTMLGDDKDAVASEKASVEDYEALMAAKKKEIAALGQSIEDKMRRIGDLGVEIVNLEADSSDTAANLAEDQKFTANLSKNCASKAQVHQEEMQARSTELVALADTIKILNDDDALDLFKKTLPSASSFLQVRKSGEAVREEAKALLTNAQGKASDHHLDFILLALHGRKVGFEKVITLIDKMVVILGKEQADDEDKKEYCEKQFDVSEDQKKELEKDIADLGTVLAESKEAIGTLVEDIEALKSSIVALDKSVGEATAQRKAESAEYKDFMQGNTAAKELILFAKNRLNKFYNPRLYKAPPKRELSEGDQIYVNQGGDIPTAAPGGIANTGIAAFVQVATHKDAPAPPPATAAAYKTKGGETSGVTAMMDLLVQDLDKEMQVSETEEKNAQAAYEETIADAAEKRRSDSKSLMDKEGARADLESSIIKHTSEKKMDTKELMGVEGYIANLHGECDWLMKYFDVRKEARVDEIDSLKKAKDVLSGADYSFVQQSRARKFLRQA